MIISRKLDRSGRRTSRPFLGEGLPPCRAPRNLEGVQTVRELKLSGARMARDDVVSPNGSALASPLLHFRFQSATIIFSNKHSARDEAAGPPLCHFTPNEPSKSASSAFGLTVPAGPLVQLLFTESLFRAGHGLLGVRGLRDFLGHLFGRRVSRRSKKTIALQVLGNGELEIDRPFGKALAGRHVEDAADILAAFN
jgi:hypothetical protein